MSKEYCDYIDELQQIGDDYNDLYEEEDSELGYEELELLLERSINVVKMLLYSERMKKYPFYSWIDEMG